MFQWFILLLFLTIVTSFFANDYLQALQSCAIDDIIENECIRCVCRNKKFFDCSTLNNCSYTSDNLKKKLKAGEQACHPNVIYVHKNATCICTIDGNWPHAQCKKIFNYLPSENIKKEFCEPETYVNVACNVCYCNDKGQIDSERCTKNICEDIIETKGHRSGTKSVYGNCEQKNWYSLAPCQFCYCVHENKLVCNSGYNYEKLEIGPYNLNVCGQDYIKDVLRLIPNNKMMKYGKLAQPFQTKATAKLKTISSIYDVILSIINFNREQKELRYMENYESTSTEEDKDRNVKLEATRTMIKNIGSKGAAQIPYDDDKEINLDNVKYSTYDGKGEEDDDVVSETELELPVWQLSGRKEVKSKNNMNEYSATSVHSLSSLRQNLQNSLTRNLPRVINEVFNIGLRKAMVTADESCEQGSVKLIDECNICFCMKNNKMFCTKDKCIVK